MAEQEEEEHLRPADWRETISDRTKGKPMGALGRGLQSAQKAMGWQQELRDRAERLQEIQQQRQEQARQQKMQDAQKRYGQMEQDYGVSALRDATPEAQGKMLANMNLARRDMELPDLPELPALKQRDEQFSSDQFKAQKAFAGGMSTEDWNSYMDRTYGHDYHSSQIITARNTIGMAEQGPLSADPGKAPNQPNANEAKPAAVPPEQVVPETPLPRTTTDYWKAMRDQYAPLIQDADLLDYGKVMADPENMRLLWQTQRGKERVMAYGDLDGVPRELAQTNPAEYMRLVVTKRQEAKFTRLQQEAAEANLMAKLFPKPVTADQEADNTRLAQGNLRSQLTSAEASLKASYEHGVGPNDPGMWGVRQSIYDLRAQLEYAGHKVGQTMPKGYDVSSGTTVQQDRTNDLATKKWDYSQFKDKRDYQLARDRYKNELARTGISEQNMKTTMSNADRGWQEFEYKKAHPTGSGGGLTPSESATQTRMYNTRNQVIDKRLADISRALNPSDTKYYASLSESEKKGLRDELHSLSREKTENLKTLKSLKSQGGSAAPVSSNVNQYRALVAKHFPASQVDNAMAVMQGESGGNPSAHNKNTNGTTDGGLFQINSIHGHDPKKLKDPDYNVRVAAAMFKKQGWGPWVAARKLGLVKGKQSAKAKPAPKSGSKVSSSLLSDLKKGKS